MVKKYIFGKPFETDAVTAQIQPEISAPQIENARIETDKGFRFYYEMNDTDVIYGLGEANRGIDKRGYIYVSRCSDDPDH